MSRRSRVPGMARGTTFAIPVCSIHGSTTVRGVSGKFVCPTCFNEWAAKDGEEKKETPRVFEALFPNRRARRAVMRS